MPNDDRINSAQDRPLGFNLHIETSSMQGWRAYAQMRSLQDRLAQTANANERARIIDEIRSIPDSPRYRVAMSNADKNKLRNLADTIASQTPQPQQRPGMPEWQSNYLNRPSPTAADDQRNADILQRRIASGMDVAGSQRELDRQRQFQQKPLPRPRTPETVYSPKIDTGQPTQDELNEQINNSEHALRLLRPAVERYRQLQRQIDSPSAPNGSREYAKLRKELDEVGQVVAFQSNRIKQAFARYSEYQNKVRYGRAPRDNQQEFYPFVRQNDYFTTPRSQDELERRGLGMFGTHVDRFADAYNKLRAENGDIPYFDTPNRGAQPLNWPERTSFRDPTRDPNYRPLPANMPGRAELEARTRQQAIESQEKAAVAGGMHPLHAIATYNPELGPWVKRNFPDAFALAETLRTNSARRALQERYGQNWAVTLASQRTQIGQEVARQLPYPSVPTGRKFEYLIPGEGRTDKLSIADVERREEYEYQRELAKRKLQYGLPGEQALAEIRAKAQGTAFAQFRQDARAAYPVNWSGYQQRLEQRKALEAGGGDGLFGIISNWLQSGQRSHLDLYVNLRDTVLPRLRMRNPNDPRIAMIEGDLKEIEERTAKGFISSPEYSGRMKEVDEQRERYLQERMKGQQRPVQVRVAERLADLYGHFSGERALPGNNANLLREEEQMARYNAHSINGEGGFNPDMPRGLAEAMGFQPTKFRPEADWKAMEAEADARMAYEAAVNPVMNLIRTNNPRRAADPNYDAQAYKGRAERFAFLQRQQRLHPGRGYYDYLSRELQDLPGDMGADWRASVGRFRSANTRITRSGGDSLSLSAWLQNGMTAYGPEQAPIFEDAARRAAQQWQHFNEDIQGVFFPLDLMQPQNFDRYVAKANQEWPLPMDPALESAQDRMNGRTPILDTVFGRGPEFDKKPSPRPDYPDPERVLNSWDYINSIERFVRQPDFGTTLAHADVPGSTTSFLRGVMSSVGGKQGRYTTNGAMPPWMKGALRYMLPGRKAADINRGIDSGLTQRQVQQDLYKELFKQLHDKVLGQFGYTEENIDKRLNRTFRTDYDPLAAPDELLALPDTGDIGLTQGYLDWMRQQGDIQHAEELQMIYSERLKGPWDGIVGRAGGDQLPVSTLSLAQSRQRVTELYAAGQTEEAQKLEAHLNTQAEALGLPPMSLGHQDFNVFLRQYAGLRGAVAASPEFSRERGDDAVWWSMRGSREVVEKMRDAILRGSIGKETGGVEDEPGSFTGLEALMSRTRQMRDRFVQEGNLTAANRQNARLIGLERDLYRPLFNSPGTEIVRHKLGNGQERLFYRAFAGPNGEANLNQMSFGFEAMANVWGYRNQKDKTTGDVDRILQHLARPLTQAVRAGMASPQHLRRRVSALRRLGDMFLSTGYLSRPQVEALMRQMGFSHDEIAGFRNYGYVEKGSGSAVGSLFGPHRDTAHWSIMHTWAGRASKMWAPGSMVHVPVVPGDPSQGYKPVIMGLLARNGSEAGRFRDFSSFSKDADRAAARLDWLLPRSPGLMGSRDYRPSQFIHDPKLRKWFNEELPRLPKEKQDFYRRQNWGAYFEAFDIDEHGRPIERRGNPQVYSVADLLEAQVGVPGGPTPIGLPDLLSQSERTQLLETLRPRSNEPIPQPIPTLNEDPVEAFESRKAAARRARDARRDRREGGDYGGFRLFGLGKRPHFSEEEQWQAGIANYFDFGTPGHISLEALASRISGLSRENGNIIDPATNAWILSAQGNEIGVPMEHSVARRLAPGREYLHNHPLPVPFSLADLIAFDAHGFAGMHATVPTGNPNTVGLYSLRAKGNYQPIGEGFKDRLAWDYNTWAAGQWQHHDRRAYDYDTVSDLVREGRNSEYTSLIHDFLTTWAPTRDLDYSYRTFDRVPFDDTASPRYLRNVENSGSDLFRLFGGPSRYIRPGLAAELERVARNRQTYADNQNTIYRQRGRWGATQHILAASKEMLGRGRLATLEGQMEHLAPIRALWNFIQKRDNAWLYPEMQGAVRAAKRQLRERLFQLDPETIRHVAPGLGASYGMAASPDPIGLPDMSDLIGSRRVAGAPSFNTALETYYRANPHMRPASGYIRAQGASLTDFRDTSLLPQGSLPRSLSLYERYSPSSEIAANEAKIEEQYARNRDRNTMQRLMWGHLQTNRQSTRLTSLAAQMERNYYDRGDWLNSRGEHDPFAGSSGFFQYLKGEGPDTDQFSGSWLPEGEYGSGEHVVFGAPSGEHAQPSLRDYQANAYRDAIAGKVNAAQLGIVEAAGRPGITTLTEAGPGTGKSRAEALGMIDSHFRSWLSPEMGVPADQQLILAQSKRSRDVARERFEQMRDELGIGRNEMRTPAFLTFHQMAKRLIGSVTTEDGNSPWIWSQLRPNGARVNMTPLVEDARWNQDDLNPPTKYKSHTIEEAIARSLSEAGFIVNGMPPTRVTDRTLKPEDFLKMESVHNMARLFSREEGLPNEWAARVERGRELWQRGAASIDALPTEDVAAYLYSQYKNAKGLATFGDWMGAANYALEQHPDLFHKALPYGFLGVPERQDMSPDSYRLTRNIASVIRNQRGINPNVNFSGNIKQGINEGLGGMNVLEQTEAIERDFAGVHENSFSLNQSYRTGRPGLLGMVNALGDLMPNLGRDRLVAAHPEDFANNARDLPEIIRFLKGKPINVHQGMLELGKRLIGRMGLDPETLRRAIARGEVNPETWANWYKGQTGRSAAGLRDQFAAVFPINRLARYFQHVMATPEHEGGAGLAKWLFPVGNDLDDIERQTGEAFSQDILSSLPTVGSVHSTKGQEFDVVGTMVGEYGQWQDDTEEQKRLNYTVASRAKNDLLVAAPRYFLSKEDMASVRRGMGRVSEIGSAHKFNPYYMGERAGVKIPMPTRRFKDLIKRDLPESFAPALNSTALEYAEKIAHQYGHVPGAYDQVVKTLLAQGYGNHFDTGLPVEIDQRIRAMFGMQGTGVAAQQAAQAARPLAEKDRVRFEGQPWTVREVAGDLLLLHDDKGRERIAKADDVARIDSGTGAILDAISNPPPQTPPTPIASGVGNMAPPPLAPDASAVSSPGFHPTHPQMQAASPSHSFGGNPAASMGGGMMPPMGGGEEAKRASEIGKQYHVVDDHGIPWFDAARVMKEVPGGYMLYYPSKGGAPGTVDAPNPFFMPHDKLISDEDFHRQAIEKMRAGLPREQIFNDGHPSVSSSAHAGTGAQQGPRRANPTHKLSDDDAEDMAGAGNGRRPMHLHMPAGSSVYIDAQGGVTVNAGNGRGGPPGNQGGGYGGGWGMQGSPGGGGAGGGNPLRTALSSDDSMIGRTLSRLAWETSFLADYAKKGIDRAMLESDTYRQAASQAAILEHADITPNRISPFGHGPNEEGALGKDNSLFAQLGGLFMDGTNPFPMYSRAQIRQAQVATASSLGLTGYQASIPGMSGTLASLLAVSAASGIPVEQLADYASTTGGMLAMGAGSQQKATQTALAQALQLGGGTLTSNSATPIFQALQMLNPLATYTGGGAGNVQALLSLAQASGVPTSMLPQAAQAFTTLYGAGISPNMPQQLQLLQMFGGSRFLTNTSFANGPTGSIYNRLMGFPGSWSHNPDLQDTAGAFIQSLTGSLGTAGLNTPDAAKFAQSQMSLYSNIFQAQKSIELNVPQLQIQAANVQLQLTGAQLGLNATQLAYTAANLDPNAVGGDYWRSIQEYGPIGADTSRKAYFDFERSAALAGYDMTNVDVAGKFQPQTPFGLKNEEFYAGIEHQRSQLVLGRSKLTSDLAFQDNMKYLNEQESFYERELQIQNDVRQFQHDWGLRLLAAQEAVLAASEAAYQIDLQLFPYQKAVLEMQAKLLPLQLVAMEAQQKGEMMQAMGFGPGQNGSVIDPATMLTRLSRLTQGMDPEALRATLTSMSGGDPSTVNMIAQMIQQVQQHPDLLKNPDQWNANPILKQFFTNYQNSVTSGAYVGASDQAGKADAFLATLGDPNNVIGLSKTVDAVDATLQRFGDAVGKAIPALFVGSTITSLGMPLLFGGGMFETGKGFLGGIRNKFFGGGAAGASGTGAAYEMGDLAMMSGAPEVGTIASMGAAGPTAGFLGGAGALLLGGAIDIGGIFGGLAASGNGKGSQYFQNLLHGNIGGAIGDALPSDLTSGLGSIPQSIGKAFGNIDWGKELKSGNLPGRLGQAFIDTLSHIDWGNLFRGTGQLGLNLGKGLLNLWGTVANNIGTSLLNLLGTAIAGIITGGKWVGDHILGPMKDKITDGKWWGDVAGTIVGFITNPQKWADAGKAILTGLGDIGGAIGRGLGAGLDAAKTLFINGMNALIQKVNETTIATIRKADPSIDWIHYIVGGTPYIYGTDPSNGEPYIFSNDTPQTSSGQGPAHNALGTTAFQGGWSWVGEDGPELLKLPAGSSVYNSSTISHALAAIASQGSGGGGKTVKLDVSISGEKVQLSAQTKDELMAQLVKLLTQHISE